MTKKRILLWVIGLAFLSVGAKNFEDGLTIDAPLYASIARHMVETGDYFRMEGGSSDFRPFCEHPHLSFWMNAAVLNVLPAKDWAIRIPGHLCYLAILFLFFLYARWQISEAAAVLTVILIWSFSRFSNLFSAAGQEPPFLLFAAGSIFLTHYGLEKKKYFLFPLAGICLSLSMMSKGLAILPYFPAVAFLFGIYFLFKKKYKLSLAGAGLFVLGSLATLGLYYWVVKHSTNPEFFDIYWARQYTQRFGKLWTLWGLFDGFFWGKLFKESNFLFPVAFVSAFLFRKNIAIGVAFIIFIFNTVATASVALWGGQYWVPMMPWLAFLIAATLALKVKLPQKWVRATFAFSIAAVLVIQYIPFRPHPVDTHPHEKLAAYLAGRYNIRNAYLEQFNNGDKYIIASRLVWYGKMKDVKYWDKGPAPLADAHSLVYVVTPTEENKKALLKSNWCRFDYATNVWLSCSLIKNG